jgi:hypothetical protein
MPMVHGIKKKNGSDFSPIENKTALNLKDPIDLFSIVYHYFRSCVTCVIIIRLPKTRRIFACCTEYQSVMHLPCASFLFRSGEERGGVKENLRILRDHSDGRAACQGSGLSISRPLRKFQAGDRIRGSNIPDSRTPTVTGGGWVNKQALLLRNRNRDTGGSEGWAAPV